MDEVTSPDHLSSRHRWQVAWALAWPCFLFDLLLWLVTMGALRRYLDEELAESIYIICTVLSFFLIAPRIVRRTVRLNFPDFHLVAVRRSGGGETRAISYRESLSVAWLVELAQRRSSLARPVRCHLSCALGFAGRSARLFRASR